MITHDSQSYKSSPFTERLSSHVQFEFQQWRAITKVRLKWVKNKSLDHIIDTETDLKAACLLKDAIKRSSNTTRFLPAIYPCLPLPPFPFFFTLRPLTSLLRSRFRFHSSAKTYMALSENLATIEPWMFRTPFTDSWISESFACDNEMLTKALEKSLCSAAIGSESVVSFPDLVMIGTGTPTTPTASNVFGSDLESPTPKRQRNGIPILGGKVSKRKSCASKRSQTTFITADPANFRHMVQQVTGVRFGNAQLSVAPVLKPEPQRAGSQLLSIVGKSFEDEVGEAEQAD